MKARWIVLLFAVCLLGGGIGGFAGTIGGKALGDYLHFAGSDYFPDVSVTSSYNDDIGSVREYNIAGGYWDGTYRPDEAVTRGQMAAFLMRSSAADYTNAALMVDYLYFGGLYFGERAYTEGRLDETNYRVYTAQWNWLQGQVAHQWERGYGRWDISLCPDIQTTPVGESPLVAAMRAVTPKAPE